MIKKWFLILLLFFSSGYFAQKSTEGFTVAKLSKYLVDTQIEAPNENFLQQPYRYLTKGGQSYVFLSEDKQYILKIPRNSRLQNARFFASFLPFQSLQDKRKKEQDLLEKTLQSYAIAFNDLRRETGLLAIHISRSCKIEHPLRIIDKLGITHKIDPNEHPFIIQKKIVSVKEKIQELMNQSNQKGAEKHLSSLFQLIAMREKKGIRDEDPNLVKNFGFDVNIPIQIDIGRFSYSSQNTQRRIAESTEDLQHWINAHYPTLSETLDNVYKDYVNNAI